MEQWAFSLFPFTSRKYWNHVRMSFLERFRFFFLSSCPKFPSNQLESPWFYFLWDQCKVYKGKETKNLAGDRQSVQVVGAKEIYPEIAFGWATVVWLQCSPKNKKKRKNLTVGLTNQHKPKPIQNWPPISCIRLYFYYVCFENVFNQ